MSTRNLHNSAYLKMCMANFLVCTYLFALFTLFFHAHIGAPLQSAAMMLCFTAGMYVPGPFNSWAVERYSRKGLYLRSLLVILLLDIFVLACGTYPLPLSYIAFFVTGISFAVAQNTLGNTMVNDLLASEKRTKGDNLYSWYGRLGLPVGLLFALLLLRLSDGSLQIAGYPLPPMTMSKELMHYVIALPVVIAFLLIFFLQVPLKAPVQSPLVSLDRFWRPTAWPLFLMTLAAAAVEGAVIGMTFRLAGLHILHDGLYLCGGFILALLLQHVVFVDAVDRAEMVSGTILTLFALILFRHPLVMVHNVAFLLLGAGIGMMSARLLMYFLKLSGHCQRGTSQNTYMLGWRSGFCLGFCFAMIDGAGTTELDNFHCIEISLALSVLFLVAYLCLIHPWFERHKDRDFNARRDA